MKKYHESFQFEDGVLRVHLSGEFPVELLQKDMNLFQPLIEACTAHGCSMALIDARELQVRLETYGIFRAGEDAASMTRTGLRIAFVARKNMIDPFFETVVANRAGIVKVFSDIDLATAWLKNT